MYLPTLGEILEGLHRAMETAVIPALDDAYARSQATAISAQLATLMNKWEQAPAWIDRENGEMREALTACRAELAARAASDPRFAALQERIDATLAREYPPDQPTRSPLSLAEEGQHLGEAMEEAIRTLQSAEADAPADPALGRARAALRKVIWTQADRRDPKLDASAIQHRN